MKTFFTTIFLLAFAIPAFAAGNSSQAFALYSAASGAVKTSDAVSVRSYKTKSLTVSGATLNSNASAVTYKNMSGTLIAQCAPTSSGPWSTCISNENASSGTSQSVSRTTNGVFTWNDAVAYIRLHWTAGTLGTKLKAWFNFIE